MSRRAITKKSTDDRSAVAWMRRAIDIARPTYPHPNPRVGAVLVSAQGNLLTEAVYGGNGKSHAEVAALLAAGGRARGGTLFVTLEPCRHHGRTPPCTDAILESGVASVVIGARDPDNRVAGAGAEQLRRAGLSVTYSSIGEEARALDPGYFHHRSTGRPRVMLKVAATLDGQTAALDGTSQWITEAPARKDGHLLRAASDAVMIGAGTFRADDPLLNVRTDSFSGRQPKPVVIGGFESLPAASRLYARAPLIYSPHHLSGLPEGVEVAVLWHPSGVDLEAVMYDLAGRGVLDLLVEGGGKVAASLLNAGLVDHMVIYLAGALAVGIGKPMFAGTFRTLADLKRFEILSAKPVGGDLRIDVVPQRRTGLCSLAS